MKRKFIFSIAALFSIALFFSACKSSRVWETKPRQSKYPPPPPRYNPQPPARYAVTPLIISPRPGFTMNQFSDGRYYHRSNRGFLYWKGIDNRFYLDRTYLNRVQYTKWEYKEWKKYRKHYADKRKY